MNIFDQIKCVAFTKQPIIVNEDTAISLFMLQRWLSMYSAPVAGLLNATSNQLYRSLNDPQMAVDFMQTIVPRLPFQRIAYIKKTRKEVDKERQIDVSIIANLLQISQREVLDYVERDPSILDAFGSDIEVYKKNRLKNDQTDNK